MNRPTLLFVPAALLLAIVGTSLEFGNGSQASTNGYTQGNVNCDANVNANDALAIALHAAGVTGNARGGAEPAGGCPNVGVAVVGGQLWGDLTCSDGVTIADAIPPLKYQAGLPLDQFGDCVEVGQPIGGPTASPTPSPSPTPFVYVCPSFGWSVGAGSATWGCETSDRISLHVTDGEHVLLKDGVTLTDTHIEADVSTENREAALVLRAQNGENAYVAVFIPNGTPFPPGIQFYKKVGGAYFILANEPLPTPIQVDDTAHFEVDMVGTNAIVKVNGTTVININDGTYASGQVGLRAFASVGEPCDSVWDNIEYHEIP